MKKEKERTDREKEEVWNKEKKKRIKWKAKKG